MKPLSKWSKKHRELLRNTVDDNLKKTFPNYSLRQLRAWRKELRDKHPVEHVVREREATQILESKASQTKKELKYALTELSSYKKALESMAQIKRHKGALQVKAPKARSKLNHTTAVLMTSDQHIDEPVFPSQVSGLNKYNLEIALTRFNNFWANSIRLLEKLKTGIHLDCVILWIGGDGFSGDIHEDTARGAHMRPLPAVLKLLEIYTGGIEYLRKNLPQDTELKVVFAYGNHGRTTKKPMKLLGKETNLEWLLANVVAEKYKEHPGVNVVVPEGYHTYIEVYGMVLRFHHGDWTQYKGGVGGITIPINKAIASWNRGRVADLDIMGHFHQKFDGGNFVVNGSLIGYNDFALSIKAPYEPPAQMMFLIDENRGKTITAPIFVD